MLDFPSNLYGYQNFCSQNVANIILHITTPTSHLQLLKIDVKGVHTMKKSSIIYTKINGILYQNLKLPNQTNYNIGKYGLLQESYIKENKKAHWFSLIANGELNEHLKNIDVLASTN